MSDEILGHDVNGEALRAGDRVRPISGASRSPAAIGEEFTLSGEIFHEDVDGRGPVLSFVERDAYGGWMAGFSRRLRRINSGRDVFEQARDRALSQGNPDAQHEWTEPTTSQWAQAVLSGMPWTEPRR